MPFRRPSAFRPATVIDAVLGPLANSQSAGWGGRILLPGFGRDSDLIVHLPSTEAPDDRESIFYQHLQQSWPVIQASLKARALDELTLSDGTPPEALFGSLRFEALLLGDCRSAPRRWELSGVTAMDDHIITARMEELACIGYRMDG